MTQSSSFVINKGLAHNVNGIRKALGNSEDLIVKEMQLPGECPGALVYIDGMVNLKLLSDSVIEPIQDMKKSAFFPTESDGMHLLHFIKNDVLFAGKITISNQSDELLTNLLTGDILLFADGYAEALHIGAAAPEDRSVTEPLTQTVVRGPMEAFTETLHTNTALIRRKIKDSHLWLETRSIGKVTKTTVAIMYLSNVANEKLVEEVRQRLDKIDIDGVLEGGYIEEFIQDKAYTPFPTVFNSERPDVIAAGLLEGRIAVLVDGTPFVLLVPALIVQFFQSPEDYTQRFDISTLIRLMRYLSFFITMLAPSLYIAITTFHQEILPTSLLISLASQREGVPFPAFIEALLMEVTYEILREAGVRMPRTVGQAVSIVGTLVIGQAAVEAGIISAAMVIVVSITAISSYVIPANNLSITVRMIRFAMMGLGASFGLYGILIGVIGVIIHLSTLRSFGIPYTSSVGPFERDDQKDTLFRFPWPRMLTRPKLLNQKNLVRQDSET